MRRIVLSFFLELLIAGAFLYYAGGMSLRSSLAVAFLIAIVFPEVQQKIASRTFAPHEMYITPHIGVMLLDLGLVTESEWQSLVGPRPPLTPWTSLHPVHYSIHAVVLSEDTFGDKVVHWTGLSKYTRRIRFESRLDFIKFPHKFTDWSPDFFVNPGSHGYELGISVNDEWWKSNAERLEPRSIIQRINHEHDIGRVELSLAVLPYEVFHRFYVDWSKDLEQKIKQKVASTGWKAEELGNSEIGYFGESYDNKYAEVWLRALL
jgi:hypothetical protein